MKERFLIHPIRLAICKILNSEIRAPTSELRALLDIPWGELANHTKLLKEKNYITLDDEFIDDKAKQVASITPFGIRKYQIFVALLKGFLEEQE